jgi:hypothetical protein
LANATFTRDEDAALYHQRTCRRRDGLGFTAHIARMARPGGGDACARPRYGLLGYVGAQNRALVPRRCCGASPEGSRRKQDHPAGALPADVCIEIAGKPRYSLRSCWSAQGGVARVPELGPDQRVPRPVAPTFGVLMVCRSISGPPASHPRAADERRSAGVFEVTACRRRLLAEETGRRSVFWRSGGGPPPQLATLTALTRRNRRRMCTRSCRSARRSRPADPRRNIRN